MKIIYLILGLVLLSSTPAFSLSNVYGKITDEETGEELLYANIVLNRNGVFAAGGHTDFEGNYSIPVDPGTYEMKISYSGYPDRVISGIIVKIDDSTKLDIAMTQGINLQSVVVTAYKVPLISQEQTTSGGTITSAEIRNLPTKNISAAAATTTGLSQTDEGSSVTVRGSRPDATDYYIDGNRISNNSNPPVKSAPPSPKDKEVLKTQKALKNKIKKDNLPKTPIVPVLTQEEYTTIVENDFIDPKKNNFSTFSIDVDNASYSNMRRYIAHNQTPPRAAVRVEEMINYFNYDYPQPEDKKPFSITTELGECPWNDDHKLLHIGLQGEDLRLENATPNNLVFLLDVSGSMRSANKLPLLKKSFSLLIDQLRNEDRIAIVVYAGAAGLVLPSTPVKEKSTILEALNKLKSGGSTAGGQGIKLAYKVALDNFLKDGNNRVILATDGDFNVGTSGIKDLEKLIEEKRKSDVYLTVLGFGMGNLKDNKLETLADKGNGHYAYIDNIAEAKKLFIEELVGTLYTIAKDVKIQLVFNKKNVKSYRLIGYENRLLAKEDFDDDKKDAGELGAGHTVTAIYELEIKSKKSTAELMDVKLRYKFPKEDQSRFIKKIVTNQISKTNHTSDNFRWSAAVAAFGMILKDSKYKGDADCAMVSKLGNNSKGQDAHKYRKEFLDLVSKYETMTLTSQK